MTSVTGLDDTEADTVAARFGVAHEQVRRDHLISLILAALSAKHPDAIVFFGGTALARTHLTDARLSEDVDLIALAERSMTAEAIATTVDDALLPTHGRVTWTPALAAVRDVDAAILRTDDGISVRVQLLDAGSYPAWPLERRDLEQRYSDAPPARLLVPTLESFVAWKTAAWYDRKASRDLYDLWALARKGSITAATAQLFAAFGPTGAGPKSWMFADAPSDEAWRAELAGQTRLEVSATAALAAVREAWTAATAD